MDLNKAYVPKTLTFTMHITYSDSNAGCDMLCFLGAYYGYHPICMDVEDEDKTALTTLHGLFSTVLACLLD